MLVYLQADGTIGGLARCPPGKIDETAQCMTPSGRGNNGNSAVIISAVEAGDFRVACRKLSWWSDGRVVPVIPESRAFYNPSLSPDEGRIAVLVTEGQKSDVWIYDATTTTFSRLTTAETVTSVSWTAEGTHIVFAASGERARSAVWRQRASGGSPAEKLFEHAELTSGAVLSPDSRSLVSDLSSEQLGCVARARPVEP